MRTAVLSRSMFQRVKPPRAGRPDRKDAPKYLRWLRSLPCACGGKNPSCSGAREAAHVDHAGKGTPDAKGVSTKVADRFSLPLSSGCHQQQTAVLGWPEFEKTLPLGDAEALSQVYWTEWPGRREWERQLEGQGA